MQPPTCTDGIANGGETDADCGGGVCDPCINKLRCAVVSDCKSGYCRLSDCVSGICKKGECADKVSQALLRTRCKRNCRATPLC